MIPETMKIEQGIKLSGKLAWLHVSLTVNFKVEAKLARVEVHRERLQRRTSGAISPK
jgi:hypothetical protein